MKYFHQIMNLNILNNLSNKYLYISKYETNLVKKISKKKNYNNKIFFNLVFYFY